jgi:hypothetical protein
MSENKQELYDWREIQACKEQISNTLANAAIAAFEKRGVRIREEVRFHEQLRDLIERYLP